MNEMAAHQVNDDLRSIAGEHPKECPSGHELRVRFPDGLTRDGYKRAVTWCECGHHSYRFSYGNSAGYSHGFSAAASAYGAHLKKLALPA